MIVHPECRPEVMALADAALGTGGMIKFCKETDRQEIILGTEMGMIYRLKKECPDKTFYLLSPGLICPNMKYTTVEKVISSLEKMETQVAVDARSGEGSPGAAAHVGDSLRRQRCGRQMKVLTSLLLAPGSPVFLQPSSSLKTAVSQCSASRI